MDPGRALALAVALTLVACDGSTRRPGGPGGGGSTPSQRRDAAPADSSGPEEGSDASGDGSIEPPPFDGGIAPQPFDGGVARDAEPPPPPFDGGGFLDAAPSRPDAAPPFDGGVTFPDAAPRPDAAPSGPDSGMPALQTQVTAIAGSSSIRISASDAEFITTLQFDNAGPGAETLTVIGASANVILTSSSFALTPSVHVAPVGQSQRGFTSVPGSLSPPIDPTLITLACTLGQALPIPVSIEFSNGAVALIGDVALICN